LDKYVNDLKKGAKITIKEELLKEEKAEGAKPEAQGKTENAAKPEAQDAAGKPEAKDAAAPKK
jgi:hypothetical protein